jgi:hypothetical protein
LHSKSASCGEIARNVLEKTAERIAAESRFEYDELGEQ